MASIPTSPSSSAAKGRPLDTHPAGFVLRSLSVFLIRRRILLSAIVFAVLIAQQVRAGARPHDLLNFRDPLTVLGVSLVFIGLGLRSWAAGILHKNTELATSGPYSLCRNPLYAGSFLMIFGFCAVIGQNANLLIMLVPLALIYTFTVRQEERHLTLRFGEQWLAYTRRTPRFVPRLGRVNLTADWRVSQWLHAKEYQAVATTLVALIGIKVWQVL